MPLQKSNSTAQQMKQQKGMHQQQIQQQEKQQQQQQQQQNKLPMASFPNVGATQDIQAGINQFTPFFLQHQVFYTKTCIYSRLLIIELKKTKREQCLKISQLYIIAEIFYNVKLQLRQLLIDQVCPD